MLRRLVPLLPSSRHCCAVLVIASISRAFAAQCKPALAHSSALNASKMETSTFAGGCFWCVEAPYSELKGVKSAVSGYIGGSVENPNYKQVCEGDTGHAEAVRVTFDPAEVSFAQLLDVFFTLNDPTQLDRQGNDVGTQYRSAIFYASPAQLEAAKAKIAALNASGKLPGPVVTKLEDASRHTWYEASMEGSPVPKPFSAPLTFSSHHLWSVLRLVPFFQAERYHQCYVKLNPTQGYVRGVSIPKLVKVRSTFPQLIDSSKS
jgi:peptide-methionine (S)-S-oxide reductase